MKRMLLILVVVLCCSSANAADWPQWRGPSRDGKSEDTGLMKSWPQEGPKLLWSFKGLGKGFSTVSVADGLIYTTGMIDNDGWLFAIDLQGNLVWKKNYGPEWRRSHPGARSTPTIEQGSVYVMSGNGTVACFDAKTGGKKWSVDVVGKFDGKIGNWGISESVLIDDNNLICTPGGQDAAVVALDKRTGKTVWTTKGLSHASAHCSAIVVEIAGKKLVVTVTNTAVVGIDAETGTMLWQQENKHHKDKPRHVNPNTLLYHDNCIHYASRFVGSTMLRISDDAAGISGVWSNKALDPHHGGTIVIDGYIYGASTKGGDWMCLDWKTGEVMYQTEWLGKGSLAYADGMLYCYEEDKGTVALVRPSPKEFDIVSSFEVGEGTGKHWAHPVVSNCRLYIRHGDALMAFDVMAK